MDKKLLTQNLEKRLNIILSDSTFKGIFDAYGEKTVNRVQKHRHGRKPRTFYGICDWLIAEYRSES
jgi:hypothetical protein